MPGCRRGVVCGWCGLGTRLVVWSCGSGSLCCMCMQQHTKRVIKAALDGEIADHLGYENQDPAGKDGGNSRNGVRAKTVLTDVDRSRSSCRGTGRTRSRLWRPSQWPPLSTAAVQARELGPDTPRSATPGGAHQAEPTMEHRRDGGRRLRLVLAQQAPMTKSCPVGRTTGRAAHQEEDKWPQN